MYFLNVVTENSVNNNQSNYNELLTVKILVSKYQFPPKGT